MIPNRLPEKHEVSEKAKEIGRRVSKRVVLKLLEDRDRKIAQLEIERQWFIEWHRLWYMKGSVKRWMLLTRHRMKTPESLKFVLGGHND